MILWQFKKEINSFLKLRPMRVLGATSGSGLKGLANGDLVATKRFSRDVAEVLPTHSIGITKRCG